MNVTFSRQPVFDRNEDIFGYDIAFDGELRDLISGFEVDSEEEDGKKAIWQQFLAPEKVSFLSIPDSGLFQEFPFLGELSNMVFSLSEDLDDLDDIRERILRIKAIGNRFSTNDPEIVLSGHQLAGEMDFIQITLRECEEEYQPSDFSLWHSRGYKIRVDQIDTMEQFNTARERGVDLFKGRFFKIPALEISEPMTVNQLSYFQLLKEIRQPHIQLHRLEQIIERDATLSFRLMQYINSSHFGMRYRIRSIQHGLSLLGEAEIQKWATMLIVTQLSRNKPLELMTTALVRGHFCESMALKTGQGNLKHESFFLGLISVLDAMLNRNMDSLLKQLPVSSLIVSALLGSRENQMSLLLQLIVSYEDANWLQLAEASLRLRITEEEVVSCYLDSLVFADSNLGG